MIAQSITLEGLEAKAANTALWAASQMLLPNPGLESDAPSPEAARNAEVLLNELRNSLGLIGQEATPRYRARLLEALTDLQAQLLEPERIAAAKERLGQRGDLPPSAYTVEFSDLFKGNPKELFANLKLTKEAIHHADQVQHLEVPPGEQGSFDAVSLFLKWFDRAKGADAGWLLVHSLRSGTVPTVAKAWWLFRDEVDLENASTPMDALKAFAEAFGVDQQVGGQHGKFFAHITASPSEGLTLLNQAKSVRVSASMKLSGDGSMNFQLLYAVDVEKYRKSVIRHGRNA